MKFIIQTAFKYSFSRACNQRRSTFVIIVGVCVSFVAMLILSSVMNGLQSSQLDRLRNLDSFDIVLQNTELSLEEIENMPNVQGAYYFIDTNVLISNLATGQSSTARIRGIDLKSYLSSRASDDLSYYRYEEGNNVDFTLSTSMQNRFGARIGDSLQVTYLRKGKTTTTPYNRVYTINGLYVSSLSDFSSNTAFVDINDIVDIFGKDFIKIGIFCDSNLDTVIKDIKHSDNNVIVTSWKEANRTLYSALMLEKTLMIFFLCFVFIIIGVNLKNSTKRLLDNKMEESAILRTCGLSKSKISLIYIFQGLIATSIGSVSGLLIGFVLVKNLQYILNIVDYVKQNVFGGVSYLSSLPLNVVFNWKESLLIMVYIFVLTVFFCCIGCKKLNENQIMEVLSGPSD